MIGRALFVSAALVIATAPVLADQTDKRLDKLFAELKTAANEQAAQPIEDQIWRIWMQSDDPTVSRMMAVGVAMMSQNRNRDALAIFDQMVKLAPDFAEGWNKRATVYYVLGRYDRSAADIERTLALEPRHFGALSGLGLVRLAQDRPEEALAAFDRALAIHPYLAGHDTNIRALREKLRGKAI